MLMFVDKGGGGFDEKITDYVDMGRGLQKFVLIYFKSGLFSRKMFIFKQKLAWFAKANPYFNKTPVIYPPCFIFDVNGQ